MSNNFDNDWLLGPPIPNWRFILPNAITSFATMVGLTTIYFAMHEQYEYAVLSVVLAGALDGLDGPVARVLKSTSEFGAALDSLSDYVNFGVSPAILMYFWSLKRFGLAGWGASLLFTVCMGCRLARFNSGVDFNASKTTRNFFMGVPAPQGAALLITPLIASFAFGTSAPFGDDHWFVLNHSTFLLGYTFLVSFLLVSRIPTFSSKMVEATIGSKGLIAGFLITGVVMAKWPWYSVSAWNLIYILSLPFSRHLFRSMNKKANIDDENHENSKETEKNGNSSSSSTQQKRRSNSKTRK